MKNQTALYKTAFSLLAAVFFFLELQSLQARPRKSPARLWFEYAYKIEQKAPIQAIRMYEWSFEKGLSKEKALSDIAFWRLYYLYIQEKAYLKALAHLEEIEKWERRKYKKKSLNLLRKKLSLPLKNEWDLKEKDILILDGGIQALAKNQKQTVQENFYKILKKNLDNLDNLKNLKTLGSLGNLQKHVLLERVMGLLVKKRDTESAYGILQRLVLDYPENPQKQKILLNLAGIEIERNRFPQAKEILFQLIGTEEFSEKASHNSGQMRLHYLMGRIYQKEKEYGQAARLFQSASLFSDSLLGQQKERMLALAARCFYLENELEKAWHILESLEKKPYTEETILHIVLQIKLKNKKMQKKLKKYYPYLQAKSSQSQSILAQDALHLF